MRRWLTFFLALLAVSALAKAPAPKSFTFTPNDWLTSDGYDRNGNTTNSASNVYQYDVMNRLTNATVGGVSIQITYDGDGNRVSKKVGGTTTYYLVDDRNPSGYAQVLEEWTSTGTPTLSRVYNYGLALVSQRIPGVSTNYFGLDGHGSTRFLTGLNGGITDTYVYDAYGILTASTGSTPNNYLYCCQQWDGDLQMYYLRARYYKPDSGRFWSMDSYDGDNQDPLSLHKYLYCHGDGINFSDPSGKVEFSIAGFSVSFSVSTYLAATAASYTIGKGISAVRLAITDGNLNQFQWFEASDLLSFVPGALFTKVFKLPAEMITKVGGKIVGKAFASGGVRRVMNGFNQWFAATGGTLAMKSANNAILELELGSSKAGFQHLLERHLVAFWNGSKAGITTFWPAATSPGEMLNLLKEAAGKYVVGGAPAQVIKLSNGISARLVVYGGKIITFFPEAGPGIIQASDLVKLVP